MAINTLAINFEVAAPCAEVWAKIADWQSQGDWMLQTKVIVNGVQTEGVGTSITAFTGPLYFLYPRIKSIGLVDHMKVTRWDPPYRCDVEHIGKILKGTGSFILTPLSEQRTRFDWSETIIAPRALYLVVALPLYIGVRISLARFARLFH
jgi:hypothetical protein